MNDPILLLAGYLLLFILVAVAGQGLFWLGRRHGRSKSAAREAAAERRRNHKQLLTALAGHTHDEAGQAVFRNPL